MSAASETHWSSASVGPAIDARWRTNAVASISQMLAAISRPMLPLA